MTTGIRRRAALAMRLGFAVLFGTQLVGIVQARADASSPLTELVDAAAQRLQIAEPVAAVKWVTHGAISDPARVQQQLDTLGPDAADQHVDPGYVTRVFADQINATEAIETPDSPTGSSILPTCRRSARSVGVAIGDR